MTVAIVMISKMAPGVLFWAPVVMGVVVGSADSISISHSSSAENRPNMNQY